MGSLEAFALLGDFFEWWWERATDLEIMDIQEDHSDSWSIKIKVVLAISPSALRNKKIRGMIKNDIFPCILRTWDLKGNPLLCDTNK